jgi:hypothetical protein
MRNTDLFSLTVWAHADSPDTFYLYGIFSNVSAMRQLKSYPCTLSSSNPASRQKLCCDQTGNLRQSVLYNLSFMMQWPIVVFDANSVAPLGWYAICRHTKLCSLSKSPTVIPTLAGVRRIPAGMMRTRYSAL